MAARRAAAKRAMATVQRRMTKVLVRVLGVYELWRIGDEDDNLCCFNMEKKWKGPFCYQSCLFASWRRRKKNRLSTKYRYPLIKFNQELLSISIDS